MNTKKYLKTVEDRSQGHYNPKQYLDLGLLGSRIHEKITCCLAIQSVYFVIQSSTQKLLIQK